MNLIDQPEFESYAFGDEETSSKVLLSTVRKVFDRQFVQVRLLRRFGQYGVRNYRSIMDLLKRNFSCFLI